MCDSGPSSAILQKLGIQNLDIFCFPLGKLPIFWGKTGMIDVSFPTLLWGPLSIGKFFIQAFHNVGPIDFLIFFNNSPQERVFLCQQILTSSVHAFLGGICSKDFLRSINYMRIKVDYFWILIFSTLNPT